MNVETAIVHHLQTVACTAIKLPFFFFESSKVTASVPRFQSDVAAYRQQITAGPAHTLAGLCTQTGLWWMNDTVLK